MKFTSYKSSGSRKNKNASPAPVGTIVAFATATAPGGWLACQGQTLSTTANPEYANLYSIIGTTYGGTGASSFKLPDLRGRIPVGAGTGSGGTSSGTGAISGTALTARARTDTAGGVETHLLTAAQSGLPAHDTHTFSETAHTHPLSADSHAHNQGWSSASITSANNGTFYPDYPYAGSASSVPQQSITFTVSSSSSGVTDGSGNANRTASYSADATNAHSNIQPSLVVSYIIKL
jgi:microcystin-dependent protein